MPKGKGFIKVVLCETSVFIVFSEMKGVSGL